MESARILVVEDEVIIAMEIEDRLRNMGYEVPAVVATGSEAIDKAQEIRPNLVLMDIMLKGDMDGVIAATKIRQQFDLPVIYLTAYADDNTLQRAKVTEPFGYLIKPFEERELYTIIEMALYKHKIERQLRESMSQIEQAKLEWEITTNALPHIICLLDAQKRIIRANRTVEEWGLGTITGAAGQGLHELFHPHCVEPTCYLAIFLGEAWEALLYGRAAEHEDEDKILKRHLYLQARPVSSQGEATIQDRASFAVIVVHDITERKQAEETLRQHAAELQVRNEELDAFAHTVAHDLKNPLGLALGFAETMTEGYETMPDQERQEILKKVVRYGHKMKDIIDGLLLLASVRKMEVGMRPLDMAAIVAEVHERLGVGIAEAQAEVIVPESWPVALGYGPWVEEVWINYLSNALKYGGQPPRIELGATLETDGMIRFEVRDNGPGLTLQEQVLLFRPFTRLAQSNMRGHGLGLSIVRRIVEKLGGQVGVESELGHGSTFSFTLPSKCWYVVAQKKRRTKTIIDTLLRLANVNQTEVAVKPLDMTHILAEAQHCLAPLIESYQAKVILPEKWPVVLGYDLWVEEIWANYLDNALKYGGRPPHIELGVSTQGNGMACFWIRDNGVGMTSEEQARLFTPFTRLDQTRSKGDGLGLAVVQRIVERLGGEVGVQSEAGQGSLFYFTLPLFSEASG
jgi:signal transduction histidine kinase